MALGNGQIGNVGEEEDMTSFRTLVLIHCCIGIAGFCVPGAIAEEAKEAKVEICHIPPGNPDNAHTITISENALSAHLDHGDRVGACDPAPTGEVRESGSQSECVCPRPGVWRVNNLDGWMECNALGIKRKLKGADKNDGAIWILNDDCSSIFSEAYEKGSEDVIMDRGRDCLFFGLAPGEEQGAEVIFDGAYKLEKKMQKELEKARETLDEHREQIDEYLEKTEGGKAFGGINGGE